MFFVSFWIFFFPHQFPSDSQDTRVHITTRVKEQPVRFLRIKETCEWLNHETRSRNPTAQPQREDQTASPAQQQTRRCSVSKLRLLRRHLTAGCDDAQFKRLGGPKTWRLGRGGGGNSFFLLKEAAESSRTHKHTHTHECARTYNKWRVRSRLAAGEK